VVVSEERENGERSAKLSAGPTRHGLKLGTSLGYQFDSSAATVWGCRDRKCGLPLSVMTGANAEIKIGQNAIRFLLEGEASGGSVAVFEFDDK
jgi:hypothetical protein